MSMSEKKTHINDSMLFALYSSKRIEMDIECKKLILLTMRMNYANKQKLQFTRTNIVYREMFFKINVSQMEEKSKRLQQLILKNRKEYWSSLATKKCIQPSTSTKPIVYKLNNKNVQKKSWNTNRLNELSKPRFDYYECTEEIVRRRFRRVDISRIYDLAIPRRTASDVERAPHKCNCCKVPLYMLLPRIERLSVPPRRTDITEHVKTDEDTFSVKKSALKYVASERLKRLATPRLMYQDDF